MSGQTRRTKAQKLKTVEKRQDQFSYTYTASEIDSREATTSPKVIAPFHSKNSVTALFKYDVNLIYTDLKKTVLITVVILVCLTGLYFFSGQLR